MRAWGVNAQTSASTIAVCVAAWVTVPEIRPPSAKAASIPEVVAPTATETHCAALEADASIEVLRDVVEVAAKWRRELDLVCAARKQRCAVRPICIRDRAADEFFGVREEADFDAFDRASVDGARDLACDVATFFECGVDVRGVLADDDVHRLGVERGVPSVVVLRGVEQLAFRGRIEFDDVFSARKLENRIGPRRVRGRALSEELFFFFGADFVSTNSDALDCAVRLVVAHGASYRPVASSSALTPAAA